MKKILFCSFLLSLNLFAQEHPSIDQWVLQNRKELKQNIKVYHWGTRGTLNDKGEKLRENFDESIVIKRLDSTQRYSDSGPIELKPKEGETYIKEMARNFHRKLNHQTRHSWNAGEGLYFALEPISSAHYAGENWFLLEVTIPKGTYYLDLPKRFMHLPELRIKETKQVLPTRIDLETTTTSNTVREKSLDGR